MRNPGGYASVFSPEPSALRFDGRQEHMRSGVFETDTFSCKHCNRVTHVRPKMDAADMGGLCKVCMGLVCKYCVGRGCDPLEAKLERAERRERLYQATRER